MEQVKKILEESRYKEGQIAFPNNGTTHVLTTEQIESMLMQATKKAFEDGRSIGFKDQPIAFFEWWIQNLDEVTS